MIFFLFLFDKYINVNEHKMHQITKPEENILYEPREKEAMLNYLEENDHYFSSKVLSFTNPFICACSFALVTTHGESFIIELEI
jgi:hypothetical protein